MTTMDFEVQRCTRRCAASDRELAEGETYYSVLLAEGGSVRRVDYAAEAWKGPPEQAIGWWRSRIPTRDEHRVKLAPNDVLRKLFQELEGEPEKQDMRYVLSLLMVRRRLLQLEGSETDEHGRETLRLYSPREEVTHEVQAVAPGEARIEEIQDELAKLLFAEAT